MSDATAPGRHDRFSRLPAWLRPRARELPGSGRLRLIETTLLALLGLLLAIATVNDVARQTHINHRLIGAASKHEVVCWNTSPGGRKARTQLCLVMYGSLSGGRRSVHGGWYLPPKVEDVRGDRYGCFGPASRGMCPR